MDVCLRSDHGALGLAHALSFYRIYGSGARTPSHITSRQACAQSALRPRARSSLSMPSRKPGRRRGYPDLSPRLQLHPGIDPGSRCARPGRQRGERGGSSQACVDLRLHGDDDCGTGCATYLASSPRRRASTPVCPRMTRVRRCLRSFFLCLPGSRAEGAAIRIFPHAFSYTRG